MRAHTAIFETNPGLPCDVRLHLHMRAGMRDSMHGRSGCALKHQTIITEIVWLIAELTSRDVSDVRNAHDACDTRAHAHMGTGGGRDGQDVPDVRQA